LKEDLAKFGYKPNPQNFKIIILLYFDYILEPYGSNLDLAGWGGILAHNETFFQKLKENINFL
jgi:hypothetical protein